MKRLLFEPTQLKFSLNTIILQEIMIEIFFIHSERDGMIIYIDETR